MGSRKNDSVLALQSAVFSQSGRFVVAASSTEQIQEQIEGSDFDVFILNHTLPFADRKLLARKIKTLRPASGVLVLHHSGSLGNPYVDLAVDSRSGAQAMLRALERVETMLHARSHRRADFEGEFVVVADKNRNYTFVTDSVCDLLGYDRAMLLDLRIEDVVDGAAPVVVPLFEEFVASGKQTGRIVLRHRSGRLVPVQYWSSVEPDGCMIARWEPVDGYGG
ncbi:MAG TPA: PAS domain-containing protein [Candidatus Angelobacter sp.]